MVQFKKQQFQLDAVGAIADLFQGKPNTLEFSIWRIKVV